MDKEKKPIIKPIGSEMWELIKEVEKLFEKQYGFKPSITNLTNFIAKRIKENKIFQD